MAIKNKFSRILAEKHSISRLCVGREKLDTEDVIGQVLTISDCDVAEDVQIDGKLTTFSVYTFKEYPDNFLYGGIKLTEIAPDIIEIANNEGKRIEQLEIQIMLKSTRTKGNNSFTDVEFI